MSKDIYKKLFLYLSTFIMILTLPGLKYVFGDNDHTGWHKENGLTYYYLSNGKKATGLVNIKMDSYYFMKKDHKVLKKGAMVYGWKNIGKYYYFFNRQSGAMVKGEYIDGVYLRDNGKAKLKSGDKKIIDQFINARKETQKKNYES